ncbi:MAG: glycosyltransferase family protein [Desulfobulbales bacterium]
MEKKNQQKYEQRVIDRLSRYYDTVLVHGDPDIIRLDATFSRIKDITTPIIYTGYVCQQATEDEGRRHRLQLRVQPGEKLIVASAGSGSVGLRLLLATVHAAHHLSFPFKMYIFTGPYMEHADVTELQQEAPANIIVERFADRFPVWLTAADLSISMGGYNTTMNVLAAGIPSLIYPFSQNREQRLRCQRLARVANLELLEDMDLSPRTMAGKISRMFDRRTKQVHLRLDGAEFTNNWLTQWINVK